MTLLHQTPNHRNGIEPPEKRQDATGDLIDLKPFMGLVDYYLGWPDRHWSRPVGRLTPRRNGPGIPRKKAEKMTLGGRRRPIEEAIPGRSARSR